MTAADIAIKVENLSKCYHIYDKPHDRLLLMLVCGRKQFLSELHRYRVPIIDLDTNELMDNFNNA